jgi:hypothetical protein
MAQYIIQHASVFTGSAKVATCHQFMIKLIGGDEAQFADAGFAAFSQGATTSTGELTEIVPVQGTTFSFDKAIIAKQDLQMAFATIDTFTWQTIMRPLDSEYNSDVQKGTLNRKVSLGGGVPQIT